MSNDFANLEVPSVQAQAEPQSAKLGDLVTLRINVSHPSALGVDPPALPKELGTFEVYASTRMPSEVAGDKSIDHFQAVLQNFTTGQQVIPGIDVPYKDPLGKMATVKTPPITVTIQEVAPGPKDKGDIRGIKGVIGPTAWSPWWWLVPILLVVGLGLIFWHKRKRALAGPPPPPPIPADITAMEKLKTLGETDWPNTGRIKEFYSAISDILREYLEKGFQVSALERTTSEILRDLRKATEITTESQLQLRELLDASDLVKFAKFRPDPSEAKDVLAAGVKFVEATREILRKEDDEFEPLEKQKKKK